MARLAICMLLTLSSMAQARSPALVRALQADSMAFFVQLIKGGTDVNAINNLGRTAVHYAVALNNLPALELLLAAGADPNIVDNEGKTALDLWHRHENEVIRTILRDAGAVLAQVKVEPEQNTDVASQQNESEITEAQDLWQAAANNDRAGVERLLAAGADAKAKNNEGKAPFHIAVDNEHDALAAILLKAAQGINGKDEKGWTPIVWAIVSRDWELVREFIREGARPYLYRARPFTAWHVAEVMESTKKFFDILAEEMGVDAVVGNDGSTLLMRAAYEGDNDAVKMLLEKGADIDLRSYAGWTALEYAIIAKQTETAKLLIGNGANISAGRFLPLQRAIVRGDWKLVRKLIREGMNISISDAPEQLTALGVAEVMKSTDRLFDILAEEMGVDAVVRNGITMLMFAVQKGHTDVVKVLLAKGADPNMRLINGRTALIAAVRKGSTEIVQLLIDSGADLNLESKFGETALIVAVEKESTEMVQLLIDNGADLNVKNKMGETALDIAKKNQHQEIIQILQKTQEQQAIKPAA